MSTSIETIKKIILDMKQELGKQGSGGLEQNRILFDESGLKAPLPDGITIQEKIINTQVSADWFRPEQVSDKVVIYLHGGGFSVGSSRSHRPLCARIAAASHAAVLCVNYRLAPEHKYPLALEDALASYQCLLETNPPENIIIAGDSAGGGLAMALLLLLKERKIPMPRGAIGISAWLDLECSSNSYQSNKDIDLLASADGLRFVGRGYANKKISTHPLVSPFYAKDLSGLCPLLLQVGSAETLLDENITFADQAKKDGVMVTLQVWPNMVHVWHSLYSLIPEAEQAITTLGKWIQD